MGLWGPDRVNGIPACMTGGQNWVFNVPPIPGHSVILWFHDSVILCSGTCGCAGLSGTSLHTCHGDPALSGHIGSSWGLGFALFACLFYTKCGENRKIHGLLKAVAVAGSALPWILCLLLTWVVSYPNTGYWKWDWNTAMLTLFFHKTKQISLKKYTVSQKGHYYFLANFLIAAVKVWGDAL